MYIYIYIYIYIYSTSIYIAYIDVIYNNFHSPEDIPTHGYHVNGSRVK